MKQRKSKSLVLCHGIKVIHVRLSSLLAPALCHIKSMIKNQLNAPTCSAMPSKQGFIAHLRIVSSILTWGSNHSALGHI